MRLKIVLSTLLLAFLVLGPALYFHFRSVTAAPAVEAVAAHDAAVAPAASVPPILRRAAGPPGLPVSGPPPEENAAADPNSPEHAEFIAERKAELYQMGISQKPGSLPAILARLHDANPEIREAAVTATMDFGSKDAIPTLRNELAWAEDPREKADLQQAIDFLQLPPFELDENGGLARQPVDLSTVNH